MLNRNDISSIRINLSRADGPFAGWASCILMGTFVVRNFRIVSTGSGYAVSFPGADRRCQDGSSVYKELIYCIDPADREVITAAILQEYFKVAGASGNSTDTSGDTTDDSHPEPK